MQRAGARDPGEGEKKEGQESSYGLGWRQRQMRSQETALR